MNSFSDTVEKLASTPVKVALLKEANFLNKLFGIGKKTTGSQSVAQSIAGTAGAAAIVGSGALLANEMRNRLVGNVDQERAQHSEVGKLTAQNTFKAQMVNQLADAHAAVIKDMLKDEVIGKADKKMIRSAYQTMKRFAPNLAADNNAARSFLREHAIYGTGPSYASLKNLAEAEQAVARAGGALPG